MMFPITYRIAGLSTGAGLAGVRYHGERRGGDLSHVTPPEQYKKQGRTAPVVFQYDERGRKVNGNSRNWVDAIRKEVKVAARQNKYAQVSNLEEKGNFKGAKRRAKEGDKAPYRTQKSGGPLREMLLTANAQYFHDKDRQPGKWDVDIVRQFVLEGVRFLEAEWGEALRYVRIDFDEGAPHIHAVAAPWVTTKTPAGAAQRMLVPRRHKAAEDTEKAQDRAGEWFEGLGLTRGEKRAQARREALADGKAPLPQRCHIAPAEWRRQKAADFMHREAALSKREKEAEIVLNFAAQTRCDAIQDRDARAAIESAQFEAARRETAKDQAIAQAKASKASREAEVRRREAIAKAAKVKAAKMLASKSNRS